MFLPLSRILQILVLPAMLTSSLWAKDDPVTLGACPPAVQSIIQQYSRTARLESIGHDKKSKSGGPEMYEAKFRVADGRRFEVHITANGTVVKVEPKSPK